MKEYKLFLQRPVKVTPLAESANVTILSADDIDIQSASNEETSRVRSITLAQTGRGVLSRSPMGLNRTVKITLPVREASEEEFHNQMELLFERYQLIKDSL